jgi:hypothetical protein
MISPSNPIVISWIPMKIINIDRINKGRVDRGWLKKSLSTIRYAVTIKPTKLVNTPTRPKICMGFFE